MKRVIALTGGIGAGKSMVASVLRAMGVPVYDCDAHAKMLMDGSDNLKSQLTEEIAPGAVRPDGSIDRPLIASIVFADPVKLRALNTIVHGAVRADLRRWIDGSAEPVVAFETAIPGPELVAMSTEAWHVDAPQDVRIERVKYRSRLTESQIRDRIAAQPAQPMPGAKIIHNVPDQPLLPQIEAILSQSQT